jgi:arabinofuranan 3-O-arabinosyltransferase
MTTDRLVLTFGLPLKLSSFDPYTRAIQPLGVGVSELEVGGADVAAGPGTPVSIPCGAGPVVTVDGRQSQTSAETTIGDLRALRPVRLTGCAGEPSADLGIGPHRLATARTDLLTVTAATLTRDGAAPSPVAGRTRADIGRWDAEHRTVRVAARDEPTLLVVPENVNPGWTATLGGRRLETVAVDGWQQGYVLPAGAAGTVTLDFGPGTAYRAALGAGAVAVLVLLGLAVLPGSPLRPAAASHRRRRAGTAVVWAAAVVGTALVGGIVGLAALLVAAVAARLAGRRGGLVLGIVTGAAAGAAGILLVAAPGGTGTARQVLAVVAVAAVAASVLRRSSPVRA